MKTFKFGKFQGLKCMDPLLEMWLSSSRYVLTNGKALPLIPWMINRTSLQEREWWTLSSKLPWD
ncbi:unnamed protein product, partial [Vitis vinifera]|uniref:Uncharacterized protein n=1 Tax=Vitis vinifera TaxID=29760 RepID=D7TTY7_VITVI